MSNKNDINYKNDQKILAKEDYEKATYEKHNIIFAIYEFSNILQLPDLWYNNDLGISNPVSNEHPSRY